MLATLMALQAGLPPLDFRDMIGRGMTKYIKAVQSGMERDYEQVFEAVISKTLRTHRQP